MASDNNSTCLSIINNSTLAAVYDYTPIRRLLNYGYKGGLKFREAIESESGAVPSLFELYPPPNINLQTEEKAAEHNSVDLPSKGTFKEK